MGFDMHFLAGWLLVEINVCVVRIKSEYLLHLNIDKKKRLRNGYAIRFYSIA